MKITGLIIGTVLLLGSLGCKANHPEAPEPVKSIQAPVADKYLNVDGLNIRYKIEGQKGRPTLVLLHGFTSSLESWDGLVAELEDDYSILRFDMAGHGLTGPDPQQRYGHDDFVSAVHGLVDGLGIKNPILIGNSMGGNTAWRYAASYPNDISNLVLIDASGFPLNGLSDEPLPLSPTLESYFLKPTKFAVNYGLKNQYTDNSKIPDGRADKILEMMTASGNGQAFVDIYKAYTLPDPTEILEKITVPTLIVWGEEDSVVPVTHANLFEAAIRNSHIYIIENAGHVPHEENPQKTANVIRAFINQ